MKPRGPLTSTLPHDIALTYQSTVVKLYERAVLRQFIETQALTVAHLLYQDLRLALGGNTQLRNV